MELKEAYRVMQANCGIEVGDKVRCLRHFKRDEFGSECISTLPSDDGFDSAKARFVEDRAVGVVAELCDDYVSVDCGPEYAGEWHFPCMLLEIVEKVKPEKMIVINGKMWSEKSLAEALRKHAE